MEIISPCSSSPCLTSLVSALTTSHAITLSGLYPSQLYSYRILSKDSSNNLAAFEPDIYNGYRRLLRRLHRRLFRRLTTPHLPQSDSSDPER